MDSRLSLFHSDLFLRRDIGTKDQIDDLRRQILETKNTQGTALTENNPNCWRSNANYQNLDWLMKATQELTMRAAEYYFEMDEFFKGYVTQKRININYWTNVNDPGGGNVLHTHEKDCFAAVYYLDAEDTGLIHFSNPANVLNQCNRQSPFTRAMSLPPEDNSLILWPAWIPHEVEVNQSNKQRINLAFSIMVM